MATIKMTTRTRFPFRVKAPTLDDYSLFKATMATTDPKKALDEALLNSHVCSGKGVLLDCQC